MPVLLGISCHGSACTAVGEQVPPAGVSSASGLVGTVVPVSAGTAGSVRVVAASGGFVSVSRLGSFYAALGAASAVGKTSEVTVG